MTLDVDSVALVARTAPASSRSDPCDTRRDPAAGVFAPEDGSPQVGADSRHRASPLRTQADPRRPSLSRNIDATRLESVSAAATGGES